MTAGAGKARAGEGDTIPWHNHRDEWWDEAVGLADDEYDTTSLPSNRESMLLYSSGTTGRPKGIVYTHAGVQLQCVKEIHFGFDYRPEDLFLGQ